MKKIRIGLMGFGEIPRHIFRLCLEDDRIEIVAIGEIGRPEIFRYLLQVETKKPIDIELDGNFLVSKNGRTRMLRAVEPGDVPWDIFDIDFVIDGTGKYKSKAFMEKHLQAGAKRVILSHLPTDTIDRIVVMGVNDHKIETSDKLISAGSATTNATAIMLKILNKTYAVDYALLTTVHSYTSDQPLRDKASNDYRRSRSAAENIIPNETPTPHWIQTILPEFKGRIEGCALNVPVPNGSLLDLTTVFKSKDVKIEKINDAISKAAIKFPDYIQVVEDPIVSTDVIDNSHSVVYDQMATLHSPYRMLKTLTWYHASYAMAARIIDIIIAYHNINKKGVE